MVNACCVWCLKLVKMPDGFNPKSKTQDAICSPECKQSETQFRLHFSDELIGQRNFEQFGVNPNHRGYNEKKRKDT